MKTVITIGCEGTQHEQVFSLLRQAGVQEAKAGKREGLSPHALQALMLKANDVNLTKSKLGQVKLGKLWNELATDLFVANLAQPLWGWCDAQSVVFMDYWRGFDNQVRLLLVYNAPHNFLAQRLGDTSTHTQEEIVVLLAEWRLWNSRLLSYAQRYPYQTLLVSSDRALSEPLSLLQSLQTEWGLALSADAYEAANTTPLNSWCPLQARLAKELVPVQDAAWEVYNKLQETAALSNESAVTDSPQQAWAIWNQVRQQLHESENRYSSDLAVISKQLEQCRTSWDKEKSILTQQIQGLAAEKIQLEQQSVILAADHAKTKQMLDIQVIQHTKREVELKTAVQTVKENIQKEQAAWNARQAELQKAVEIAKKQASEQDDRHKASQARLQDQFKIEQVKWEKEKSVLQEQFSASKAEALAFSEKLKSAQVSSQSAEALTHRLKDCQEENELLLVQLHQVQEELEQLFVKHSNVQVSVNQSNTGPVETFWRRHQPQEIKVDLRGEVAGDNWYHSEPDGRWAGPNSPALLEMPPLHPGHYQVEMVLVDAMSTDLLQGLMIESEGHKVPLDIEYPLTGNTFPVRAKARLYLHNNANNGMWKMALHFQKTVSPSESGGTDERRLSVRVQNVSLYRLLS